MGKYEVIRDLMAGGDTYGSAKHTVEYWSGNWALDWDEIVTFDELREACENAGREAYIKEAMEKFGRTREGAAEYAEGWGLCALKWSQFVDIGTLSGNADNSRFSDWDEWEMRAREAMDDEIDTLVQEEQMVRAEGYDVRRRECERGDPAVEAWIEQCEHYDARTEFLDELFIERCIVMRERYETDSVQADVDLWVYWDMQERIPCGSRRAVDLTVPEGCWGGTCSLYCCSFYPFRA